ncbi:AraC family transcriptional regulator [Flagellimonas meridianipacifica]|uniref:DNA gyrase inhibitor GyrI n=1 Tax=Flagellimonas meridianipacifica TaxID=1080225 RepID=A0A2T0MAX0_9FLAO|nr:GyrI-like domain-containing protein [Allomuricauda pacifica]PRX54639.1 DNA gyrase inhibitor GyrI [Allomuricauda pacifica]
MITTTSEIRVETFPKRFLACVQNVGTYKGDTALFQRLFTKVKDWAEPKGLLENTTLETITIYHDDSGVVPEEEQTISVGFTVPEGTQVEGDIKLLEIPKGNYLVGTFEILSTEYGDAWNKMMDFVEKGNIKSLGDTMYESYKNDPRTHPEGKHIVDICMAV